jgi:hypothetical protein
MRRTMKALMRSAVGETGFQILMHNVNAARYGWMRRLIRDRARLIKKPTCPDDLDVLHNPAFQSSVAACGEFTYLETARLANLWSLCQMSNPDGAIVDVGAYKGGTALHLSNARPDAKVFACDTFEGYGDLPMDGQLDARFKRGAFSDASPASVERLFAGKGRNLHVLAGYFPHSDVAGAVRDVSFAHLDVNLYESCRTSLCYLADRTLERSVIVLDDYGREAEGMILAANEFVAENDDWAVVPMYPGQGVLLHKSWFGAAAATRPTAMLLAGATAWATDALPFLAAF